MIRVEGKNILDEGFSGSNARDMNTGKMSSEAAKFLSDTIKDAISPITASIKTNKVVIAQTASNMAKTIAENTKEFQTIIESSGEETQQEFIKLLTMMNDAQKKTGDASIAAMQDVVKQIEKLKKADTSGKLSDTLDLNKRQEEIAKPLGRQSVFGAAFKKFTNVDLRKESAWQALSPTKLFGLNPSTSDIIKSVQADSATRNSTNALGKLGAALIPNNQKRNKTTVAPKVKNAEGGRVFTTGIDRESLENKQVELLEQILAQLKKMESTTPAQSSDLGKIFESSMVRALLPLTVIVGGISGIVWTIQKLTENDYAEKTAIPILQSRDDMYKSGLGFGTDQVRQREARANSPLQRAKDSGLYDKDYITNSEIDLNVLAATTDSSVLKSILNDNDISDSDRMRVERRLGQIEREQIDTAPIIGTGVLSSSTQEKIKSTSKNTSYVMERMFPISLNANRFNPEKSNSMIGTLENPRQSTEPDMLTIPGSGVLSPEAQGMTPEVTPTADAVYKTTEAYRQMVSNVTNIFNNTTNNNGSGPQPQPIIVSSPSVRNNDNSFRFFQHSNK